MCFSFGGLFFRSLIFDDLARTFSWRNEPRVYEKLTSHRQTEWGEHLRWFHDKKDSFDFVFSEKKEGPIVGQVSVYHVKDHEAEFGRLVVDADCLGRGYGTIATLAMLYFSQSLGIRYLTLDVVKNNPAAEHVYCNCGFSVVSHTKMVTRMSITLSVRVLWDEAGEAERIDDYWTEHEMARRRKLADLVLRLRKEDERVLDAGCGSGLLGYVLGAPPWYMGTDSSLRMLALAKKRTPQAVFKYQDITRLREAADLVCCFEVLGHMANIEKPMKNLIACTKRRLVVSIWPPGAADSEWRGVHRGWKKADLVALVGDQMTVEWMRLGGTDILLGTKCK